MNQYKGVYYFDQTLQVLDPFYFTGANVLTGMLEDGVNMTMIEFSKSIISNLAYTAMFSVFGGLIFVNRDIK